MATQVSLIFPVYNEQDRLNNLPFIIEYFRACFFSDFELIVVCNACTDQTFNRATAFATRFPEIRVLDTPVPGRGNALKLGFLHSSGELIAVCAIDRAWDESFYLTAREILNSGNYDVVFGPKSHPDSKVVRPIYRTLPSYLLKIYLMLMFQMPNVDTNCIKMFRRRSCRFLDDLSNFNYFAETEFYLLALKNKLRAISVPVSVNDSNHGSKVRLSSFFQFVSESIRYKFH
jgi:glycosyltransferase involved in cell wall biosynthesis